jgi:hypothetical protein
MKQKLIHRTYYTCPGGGKYSGKLTITNKRLLNDAKFDASAKGLLNEALFMKRRSEGYLEINKADITDMQAEIFFSKESNNHFK